MTYPKLHIPKPASRRFTDFSPQRFAWLDSWKRRRHYQITTWRLEYVSWLPMGSIYPKFNTITSLLQTIVICHSMLACRKEENFKDAKKFKPERWIQNNNLHVNTESGSGIVIPFGSGKRTCPGKRFVNLELILLVAKVSSYRKRLESQLTTKFIFA